MNLRYRALLLSWLFPQVLFSQSLEGGLFLGASNYLGDLTEDFFEVGETNLCYGLFMRYFFKENLAFRGNAFASKISGSDGNASSLGQRNRGYSFETFLLEFSGMLEYDIFRKKKLGESGKSDAAFTPYLFVGIGGTFIDSDTTGLPKEAPEKKNALPSILFSVPVGGGLKFNPTNNLILGIEGGIRPVFSDLLDGISQSGNQNNDDWYFFAGITFSHKLGVD